MGQPRKLSELGLSARNGNARAVVTGIALDSRAVRPGFLFAALPGSRVHGAEFITFALRMQAGAILTDRAGAALAARELAQYPDVALVVAEDVRAAFAMTA